MSAPCVYQSLDWQLFNFQRSHFQGRRREIYVVEGNFFSALALFNIFGPGQLKLSIQEIIVGRCPSLGTNIGRYIP
jgi:hypothetical protein